MSVILSSETGDATRVPDPAPADERLAASRASPAPESAAPTCSPAGREPLLCPLKPPPSPRAPEPFAPDFDPVKSGAPEAPGFPFGSAANVPRRLPAGTAIGPVGATGCIPNAISRPAAPVPPAAVTLGGGPTGC